MSPFAESAAAATGAKVAAWGLATGASGIVFLVDMIQFAAIDPTDLATRMTIIGTAFLGLIGVGLKMWRDHLQEMAAIRKGSLMDENDLLKSRVEHYEQRDRDQDAMIAEHNRTSAEQSRLIAEQNFRLGQMSAESTAKDSLCREKESLCRDKDETIRLLSMGHLVAKGLLAPTAIIYPGNVIVGTPITPLVTDPTAPPADPPASQGASL